MTRRLKLHSAAVSMERHHADVAQLVEHHLAMVGVAGSNPVVRSTYYLRKRRTPSGPKGSGGVRSTASFYR